MDRERKFPPRQGLWKRHKSIVETLGSWPSNTALVKKWPCASSCFLWWWRHHKILQQITVASYCSTEERELSTSLTVIKEQKWGESQRGKWLLSGHWSFDKYTVGCQLSCFQGLYLGTASYPQQNHQNKNPTTHSTKHGWFKMWSWALYTVESWAQAHGDGRKPY